MPFGGCCIPTKNDDTRNFIAVDSVFIRSTIVGIGPAFNSLYQTFVSMPCFNAFLCQK